MGDCANAESIVNIRIKEASVDDLATIIYTSGTTGNSKGVMLYHYNYLEAMRIHDIRLTMVSDKDLSMCFLPLTHIFEKAWVCYCLHTFLGEGLCGCARQDPFFPEVHAENIHERDRDRKDL